MSLYVKTVDLVKLSNIMAKKFFFFNFPLHFKGARSSELYNLYKITPKWCLIFLKCVYLIVEHTVMTKNFAKSTCKKIKHFGADQLAPASYIKKKRIQYSN